jgi:hypothetical protein
VQVLEDEIGPSRVRARVRVGGDAPAVLVVHVTWSPLWRATWGGVEKPVLALSPGIMGVEVEPGEDTLELRFVRPWWHGALVLLSPLVIAAVALARRRVAGSEAMAREPKEKAGDMPPPP